MLYCTKCKVNIRTKHTKCPLCQGELIGEFDESTRMFPKLEKKEQRYRRFLQWVNFFAVLASVLSICINWIFTPQYRWALFGVAGIFCTWVVIQIGVYKRRNLLKNILWQLIIVEFLLILWDLATGWHVWSLNYFLPIGILLAQITMLMITAFQKLTSPDYMIYLLMVAVFGCVPSVLLLFDVITIRIPSILCTGVSLLLLAAFLIFQKHAVANEVSKKFHI